MLDDSQKSIESWQDKQRESAAEIRALGDKARHAAALADEYESELGNVRSQLDTEKRSCLDAQVLPLSLFVTFCLLGLSE